VIYLRPEAQTKVISMFHFALRDSGVLLLGSSEHEPKRSRATVQRDPPQVADLEQELKVTRTELQVAIRSLEIAGEEQKAVNEEALSINEEYQSTNEELLTSKEELQSLNEELAALNSQLRESLERQRTTSNDLQNILYSTGVAIFLDPDFNIRFFTPATKSLFGVIPSDVGRPLGDLTSLAADGALLTDAKTVLHSLEPIEREIEARSGAWYIRRILPYRTQNSAVEGGAGSRPRPVHRAAAGEAAGHRVHVRSRPGKGSVFAIDVMLAPSGAASPLQHFNEVAVDATVADGHRTGVILVVGDDPDVCELLELVLTAGGPSGGNGARWYQSTGTVGARCAPA
jgi:hypothetical protein